MAILSSDEAVTMIGGGRVRGVDLVRALGFAPRLVAADSGADKAMALGQEPELVVGDLDSISESARDAFFGALHEVGEQDTTDFAKTLRSIDAPLVVGVGFTGGRFDHELAAMHALMLYPERPCILVGEESFVFLTPPKLVLDLPHATDIGLFPFAEVEVATTGLKYPPDGRVLSPLTQVSTSNKAMGRVVLRPDRPVCLTVLGRGSLSAVVDAFLSEPRPPRWPARGR